MKQLFEIESDKIEILEKFRELARRYNVSFRERELAKNENPSPSGDPYFENPKNVQEILEGVKQSKEGEIIEMTKKERKKMLGLRVLK
ncbi:hypothetical protein [Cyclobacterium plantarum]|uniref:Uncharacterized protein n=1 Tax=Cyclobacterium plantarum TaxID=2716263 RepID=A0ABX0HB08_9BACT|nr:hypothetical protein [Cyclobacterium plantarum]NHE59085.1 hypothetical protein [Cyclobacterium plantarum]